MTPHLSARRARRRAVTLLELLLVLSLLVAVAAMAWPSISRAFDNRRLQLAAEQFRADLAATRLKAINTGRVFVVRHLPLETSYTIEPYADGWSENADAQVRENDLQDQDFQPADLLTIERKLPDDVHFLATEGLLNAREEVILADIQATEQLGGSRSNEPPPEMFFCYPDGSTATARFYLGNQQERCLAVDVRGLTGVVTLGEIRSVEELPR